ncbi:MAG: hemolysin family protein [Acidimicrobiales bacterium]|nr:hemolysin family protein [Acidimicrobiales bacterium]MDP6900433.1 hemolysin family protein [Acidimicrobiales bacterium]HJL98784.1 hemolysin family protein [Acidimicrobiales bacterium]
MFTIDPLLGLVAVLVLVALNGIFVAGEFSLVAVDVERVEVMAEQGHRRARVVRKLLTRLSFHLGGAQLGITVTSLLLGLLAEDTIGAVLDFLPGISLSPGPLRAVIAIGIAAVLQMIFGELAPKNLAISRPLGTGLWLGSILRIYGLLAAPITTAFNGLANKLVRLGGIEPVEELRSLRSLEDLEHLVRASSARTIKEDEARLITRTLRLSRKDAADALTPRTSMVALRSSGTISDLVQSARESGYSRFPVIGADLDDIVGMVEVKDVFSLTTDDRERRPLGDIVRPAVIVPEHRELDGVLVDLELAASRLAVVVDEHGGTAGLISREDILEELVGDIADEYDEPVPITASQRDGRVIVEGLKSRDEIEEILGLRLPDGPFETLAGFILQQTGSIPEIGQVVEWRGWKLEVLRKENLRIADVAIEAPSDVDDSPLGQRGAT